MQSKQSKRRPLDALLAKRKITRDGRDWLTLALDPFHDEETKIAGYPDADCSQTIVSCYQYQYEVATPLGDSSNWDAHIYNLPLATGDYYGVFNLDTSWGSLTEPATPVNDFQTGPLNIVTGPHNANLGPQIPKAATVQTNFIPPAGTNDLCSGITRVIAMGFEVTNTTSALNKQGAVTVYRMPQLGNHYQITGKNNASTFLTTCNGTMWREPPATVAQANLLKGTRTWDAASGVYAPCFQNSVHNPLQQMESTQTLFSPLSAPSGASIARASYWRTSAAATAPNVSASYFAPGSSVPYNTTGAFFTGLSSATTLTVKFRVWVERAPTWADPNLSVLASPSAGYDAQALELYAHVISCMPVAMPVDANSLGDWWRAVCDIVRTTAAPIGAALNTVLPGSGLLGAVVSAASNAGYRAYEKEKTKKKKPQPAPPAAKQ